MNTSRFFRHGDHSRRHQPRWSQFLTTVKYWQMLVWVHTELTIFHWMCAFKNKIIQFCIHVSNSKTSKRWLTYPHINTFSQLNICETWYLVWNHFSRKEVWLCGYTYSQWLHTSLVVVSCFNLWSETFAKIYCEFALIWLEISNKKHNFSVLLSKK